MVSVGATAGMVNYDPILPLELLVLQQDGPPRPMSVSVIVPDAQLHRVQPGASLPVRLNRTDPSALAVDWSEPG